MSRKAKALSHTKIPTVMCLQQIEYQDCETVRIFSKKLYIYLFGANFNLSEKV